MVKLKIIEALYYDPDSIREGFNVTKDLIQMADVDNDRLYYDGLYNDIFGDPAKRINKKLKIILEYNGKKYTKIYKENENINLPDDLPLGIFKEVTSDANKNNSEEIVKLFPEFHGIGVNLKALWLRVKNKIWKIETSRLKIIKKEYIITFIILLLTASSAPWWVSPLVSFLKETQKRIFTDYNDPSKILDYSLSSVFNKMNELSTDQEQKSLIDNYSGLRTNREGGQVINIDTSDNSKVLVDIQGGSGVITCNFDIKWKQKFLILDDKYIQFVGVIDRYDVNSRKILLLYCNLL